MAGNEDRKAELIAQLARARGELDSRGRAVQASLDFPARIRGSFRKHTLVWIGGGLVAGLVISRFLRRSPEMPKARDVEAVLPKAGAAGLAIAGAKIAFDIARPLLLKWLVNRAAPMAEDLMARYTARPESRER